MKPELFHLFAGISLLFLLVFHPNSADADAEFPANSLNHSNLPSLISVICGG